MTIQTDTSRADYIGNGVTVAFAVPFRFLENSHLRVIRTVIATGVETDLILDSVGADGFTVTGAGQPNGGTVTVVTAPANSTEKLSILFNIPITQLIDFIANDPFPAESHERGLDKLTLIAKSLNEVISRCFRLPASIVGTSLSFPIPQALKAIRWNASATGLENYDASTLSNPGGSDLVGFIQSGIGAVLQTVQGKLRLMIDSDDFGAIKTGVSDTSTHLQAALDRAAGGILRIQPGSYLLGAGLLIPSNTTVDARGATFYRVGALDNLIRNKSDGIAGVYTANSNISIIGGIWDSVNGPGSPSGNCTVIAFGHCSNVKVTGAEVNNENAWHHIEFNAVQNGLVRDCRFTGGLATASANNEVIQIDSADSSAQFPWFGPYDNTTCINIKVVNNEFSGTGCGVGTHSVTTPNNHNNIVIDGNRFFNIYTACVKLFEWSDAKIVNNKGDTVAFGVLLQIGSRVSNDVTIANNTFFNIGTGSGSADSRGIQVLGNSTNYCRNLVISGNKILSVTGANGTHGITVDVPQYATISGNVINSVNRSGIYVFGGRNVAVTGNVVTGENVSGGGYEGIQLGNGTLADSVRLNVQGNICATLSSDAIDSSLVRNNNITTSVSHTGNGASTVVSGNLVASSLVWADLSGSAVVDPANLVAGAGANATVTVTGAVTSDPVVGISFSSIQAGIMMTAAVTAADTVTVRFRNDSGGAIDLASGTLRVYVNKSY